MIACLLLCGTLTALAVLWVLSRHELAGIEDSADELTDWQGAIVPPELIASLHDEGNMK